MRKIEKNILCAVVLLFSHYSQAALITWDSTSNNMGESSIFTLDIIGTDFTQNVVGGGVDLSFDPSVLSVLSVSIDPVWTFFTQTGTIDNGAGTVNGIAVNEFAATITDSFTVASVQFQVIGNAGTGSSLSLTTYALNPWADDIGGQIFTLYANANVSVVPVPAAVWLFGSGLLALIGVARGKREIR